jgi:hypothetical protein
MNLEAYVGWLGRLQVPPEWLGQRSQLTHLKQEGVGKHIMILLQRLGCHWVCLKHFVDAAVSR